MVVKRSEMKTELKEKMRGGEGTVTLVHFTDCQDEKNIRLLAEITLPPGASIGNHQHDGETEYFLIVSGSGIVDDNGAEKPIAAGDSIITGNGACHSVKNTGNVPLVLHAAIVTH
ncbi:MAG: cupin domain-containing protein [Treponema sp.]|jgi:mannose-6-phosphate isomerase-like protein (cupin superfamily)|nr:cupin domain-containing protein [Treponema sp.]